MRSTGYLGADSSWTGERILEFGCGGWRAVRYRSRIVCDTETNPSASHARGAWARLGRRARRTLDREGRLEIRVESVLKAPRTRKQRPITPSSST
jgi:hypothetical protein